MKQFQIKTVLVQLLLHIVQQLSRKTFKTEEMKKKQDQVQITDLGT
jgi:hypothetical protein